jgi:uncharacterized protein YcbX
MSDGAFISALYVYPVKACRGVRVASSRVVARGFEHDRRYMIVDTAGRFISQREVPKLSLVSTAFERGGIVLSRDGQQDFLLPLSISEGPARDFDLWGDSGSALGHEAASSWMSAVLERPVSVLYMPDSHRRPVNPARARPTDVVSFADGYPFLAISEASLADLNSRLETPVEMERFRPNIVVSGIPAYGEDHWQTVRMGALGFRAPKRCDRCSVTTVDLTSGVRGKEPLRTLAKYRQEDGKVWFGMNLIHDHEGVLAVGDRVSS